MSAIGLDLVLIAASSYAALTCSFDSFSEEDRSKFEPVRIEGVYKRSFELSEFRPLNSKEAWWANSQELSDLELSTHASGVRVLLSGMLSPVGKYGHQLGYSRCLTKVEILEVESVDDSDCESESEATE